MRNVLIVAYYFPPIAASGAMRPLAWCRFLGASGWQPRVLAVDPSSVFPAHPVDAQLAARLPASLRVDRVAHGNPIQTLLRVRNRVRAGLRGGAAIAQAAASTPVPSSPSPTAGASISATTGSGDGGPLGELKHLILDWGFAFPDPQCAWLKPAVAAAKLWPRSEVPDVVLATGGPWTSLLVGQALAEHWRVPFIADYRDPWSNNPYVSFRSPLLNGRARALEASVCHSAGRIIANTPELQAQLARDYPEHAQKIVAITNGYDPDLFPHATAGRTGGTSEQAAGQGLELCHFGTVYGKRTPAVLLQTALELVDAGRLTPAHLRLRFVGSWDVDEPDCERVAQALERAGILTREPAVPHQACLQQMLRADALLVMQPDSPLQIPGKIYEYVATRRPMVLIGGEGATANLVNRFGLGVAVPNQAARIRQVLLDIIERPQMLKAPTPEHVGRFDYRQLTADVAAQLDAVCRVPLAKAS